MLYARATASSPKAPSENRLAFRGLILLAMLLRIEASLTFDPEQRPLLQVWNSPQQTVLPQHV